MVGKGWQVDFKGGRCAAASRFYANPGQAVARGGRLVREALQPVQGREWVVWSRIFHLPHLCTHTGALVIPSIYSRRARWRRCGHDRKLESYRFSLAKFGPKDSKRNAVSMINFGRLKGSRS